MVEDSLRTLNYAVLTLKANSLDFGLPVLRVRLFFIAVDKEVFNVRDWRALFAKFTECVRRSRCPPSDFRDCLLASNHFAVEKELKRKTMMTHAETESAKDEWPKLHQSFFAKEGVRWGTLRLSDASDSSPWSAVLTRREREVLAWHQRKHGDDVCCDVGPTITWSKCFADAAARSSIQKGG